MVARAAHHLAAQVQAPVFERFVETVEFSADALPPHAWSGFCEALLPLLDNEPFLAEGRAFSACHHAVWHQGAGAVAPAVVAEGTGEGACLALQVIVAGLRLDPACAVVVRGLHIVPGALTGFLILGFSFFADSSIVTIEPCSADHPVYILYRLVWLCAKLIGVSTDCFMRCSGRDGFDRQAVEGIVVVVSFNLVEILGAVQQAGMDRHGTGNRPFRQVMTFEGLAHLQQRLLLVVIVDQRMEKR